MDNSKLIKELIIDYKLLILEIHEHIVWIDTHMKDQNKKNTLYIKINNLVNKVINLQKIKDNFIHMELTAKLYHPHKVITFLINNPHKHVEHMYN